MIGKFKVHNPLPQSKAETTTITTRSSISDTHKSLKRIPSFVYPLANGQIDQAGRQPYLKSILKSPSRINFLVKRVSFKETVEVCDRSTSHLQLIGVSSSKSHCCIIM